jgi:hypothetical protein
MKNQKLKVNISIIVFTLFGLYLSSLLTDHPALIGLIMGLSILFFMYKLYMVPADLRGKTRNIEFNYASFSVILDIFRIIAVAIIVDSARFFL